MRTGSRFRGCPHRLADASTSIEIYIGMDKPDVGNSARSGGSQGLL
jgi:hypothetical protein